MSRNDDTIVRFSGLKSGRYNYRFELRKEFFDRFENEEIRDGKVEIDAVLEKTERVMVMKFTLRGEVTTLRDRCRGEMMVPIEGEESLNIRLSDATTRTWPSCPKGPSRLTWHSGCMNMWR